jgi:hypothetical protein
MPVYSQNGWLANDRRLVIQWTIPGTIRKINLEMGDGGFLLTHFAAWFDKNVEDIEANQLDDWGYAERLVRGSATDLSNHASGTGMDLNAVKHPLGAVNTFTVAQRNSIREQLKLYEGCIRWGGDYTGRKDEMHFEINATAAKCKLVADKIRRGSIALPTKPVIRKRRDNVVDNNVILPGRGQQRFICPTGSGSVVTERAFISAAVNGDSKGTVKFFFQSLTKGISNTEVMTINIKGGISDVPNKEIPAGTTQINVQYDFPNGGVVCIETLARG